MITFLRFYAQRQHDLAVKLFNAGAPSQSMALWDRVPTPSKPSPSEPVSPYAWRSSLIPWLGIPARELGVGYYLAQTFREIAAGGQGARWYLRQAVLESSPETLEEGHSWRLSIDGHTLYVQKMGAKFWLREFLST